MGGKVEKIYLKYFDAAKMRGKVDTLIRDKMNRLHLHYKQIERASQIVKSESLKRETNILSLPRSED